MFIYSLKSFLLLLRSRHINVPISSIISQTNIITLAMYINTPKNTCTCVPCFEQYFATKLHKISILILLKYFQQLYKLHRF